MTLGGNVYLLNLLSVFIILENTHQADKERKNIKNKNKTTK